MVGAFEGLGLLWETVYASMGGEEMNERTVEAV